MPSIIALQPAIYLLDYRSLNTKPEHLMPSIAEQAAMRNLMAAQSEGRLAVFDDAERIDAEVAVMDSRLRLADERIARRPAETISDLLAKFDLILERLLLDLDDGVDEKLCVGFRADLERLADCRLCCGAIQGG